MATKNEPARNEARCQQDATAKLAVVDGLLEELGRIPDWEEEFLLGSTDWPREESPERERDRQRILGTIKQGLADRHKLVSWSEIAGLLDDNRWLLAYYDTLPPSVKAAAGCGDGGRAGFPGREITDLESVLKCWYGCSRCVTAAQLKLRAIRALLAQEELEETSRRRSATNGRTRSRARSPNGELTPSARSVLEALSREPRRKHEDTADATSCPKVTHGQVRKVMPSLEREGLVTFTGGFWRLAESTTP